MSIASRRCEVLTFQVIVCIYVMSENWHISRILAANITSCSDWNVSDRIDSLQHICNSMYFVADSWLNETRSSADADNRLDAFSGQSRSTNMVPFHMLHI